LWLLDFCDFWLLWFSFILISWIKMVCTHACMQSLQHLSTQNIKHLYHVTKWLRLNLNMHQVFNFYILWECNQCLHVRLNHDFCNNIKYMEKKHVWNKKKTNFILLVHTSFYWYLQENEFWDFEHASLLCLKF
jgi:hypothetical protein